MKHPYIHFIVTAFALGVGKIADGLSKLNLNKVSDWLYWRSSDLHIARLHLEGWMDQMIEDAVRKQISKEN